MSSDLLKHVQNLDQDTDVFIYELTNYRQSNPKEIFRFSNMAGVSFNGPCEAIPCSHDVIEISSVSTQPRLEITISDAAGAVSSLIDSVDGIEGSKLTILRTKVRYLDSGSTPSTSAILQRSQLIVSRVSQYIPGEAVVVETQNPIDQSSLNLPLRTATTKCGWTYRSGVGCTYAGSAMFKLDGSPTLDPKEDVCSRDLKGCKLRFGENAVLPTSAFPTLQRR
jgi:lambda family phage minor tail protein L